ncbi:universal stress protein [Alkalicoccobacillus plakortidis]|uniref:Universal stress protein n=1 Tax=Alkalicoccobacillus plakortidis TaxID=444060 RepID=A0ABT0XJC3_9BACI|nr:universal stress protein [Alkalicoccobacillus plakortidis]MCM2675855.1 universal stress protein [Alkalicoccobacillus plakortidis]
MFKRILVATDGSKHARKGIEKAIEMVEPYKKEVHIDLVYCVDVRGHSEVFLYSDNTEADALAKRMLAENTEYLISEGISTGSFYLRGEPARMVLLHLKENDYDCLVVGSRGRNELQTLVLGSVSHKLAKHAKIPVLIVR